MRKKGSTTSGRLSLRLAPDQFETIRERAESAGMNISQYVRALLCTQETIRGTDEDFLLLRRHLLRLRWLLSTMSRDPNRNDPVIADAYLDEAVRQIDDAIGFVYASE